MVTPLKVMREERVGADLLADAALRRPCPARGSAGPASQSRLLADLVDVAEVVERRA